MKDKINAFARLKPVIMRQIAQNSVNFFKVDSFENEGFTDRTLNRWAPRKDGDTTRRLLVKTGRGRESIRTEKLTSDMALIVAGAEYMRYHNEGTEKLPKRQFMGHSEKLNDENKKIIQRNLKLLA